MPHYAIGVFPFLQWAAVDHTLPDGSMKNMDERGSTNGSKVSIPIYGCANVIWIGAGN